MRHPASGYVQGINDLLTPFLCVFLFDSSEDGCSPLSAELMDGMDDAAFDAAEADAYWCLTRLLDGVQDNYTNDQPGIQKMVFRLEEVVRRVEPKLAAHLQEHGLNFIQVCTTAVCLPQLFAFLKCLPSSTNTTSTL